MVVYSAFRPLGSNNIRYSSSITRSAVRSTHYTTSWPSWTVLEISHGVSSFSGAAHPYGHPYRIIHVDPQIHGPDPSPGGSSCALQHSGEAIWVSDHDRKIQRTRQFTWCASPAYLDIGVMGGFLQVQR